ncbi:MAG: hypothetical protein ACI9WC_002348 [Arenicella sp.]|jgi:hypothetical protein
MTPIGQQLHTMHDAYNEVLQPAKFKIDPRDNGRFDGWHEPSHDHGEWDEIHITQLFYAQGNYIDEQGFPYKGAKYYRFNLGKGYHRVY